MLIIFKTRIIVPLDQLPYELEVEVSGNGVCLALD